MELTAERRKVFDDLLNQNDDDDEEDEGKKKEGKGGKGVKGTRPLSENIGTVIIFVDSNKLNEY